MKNILRAVAVSLGCIFLLTACDTDKIIGAIMEGKSLLSNGLGLQQAAKTGDCDAIDRYEASALNDAALNGANCTIRAQISNAAKAARNACQKVRAGTMTAKDFQVASDIIINSLGNIKKAQTQSCPKT